MSQIPVSALAQIADYFKVLSELSRLQVLCALKRGAKNVTKPNYLHAYNSSPNPTVIKNLWLIPAHRNPRLHHWQMW